MAPSLRARRLELHPAVGRPSAACQLQPLHPVQQLPAFLAAAAPAVVVAPWQPPQHLRRMPGQVGQWQARQHRRFPLEWLPRASSCQSAATPRVHLPHRRRRRHPLQLARALECLCLRLCPHRWRCLTRRRVPPHRARRYWPRPLHCRKWRPPRRLDTVSEGLCCAATGTLPCQAPSPTAAVQRQQLQVCHRCSQGAARPPSRRTLRALLLHCRPLPSRWQLPRPWSPCPRLLLRVLRPLPPCVSDSAHIRSRGGATGTPGWQAPSQRPSLAIPQPS